VYTKNVESSITYQNFKNSALSHQLTVFEIKRIELQSLDIPQ
jgi:hypothetical protein